MHLHTHLHTHTHTNTYTCTHTDTITHYPTPLLPVHCITLHTYPHMHPHTDLQTYPHMHPETHPHTYTQIHTCTDTLTYHHTYLHIVIFSGSVSTFPNNHMINVFTLVRASQNESPNSRYPRNPYYSWAVLYKGYSLSPGLTRVTPPFGNASPSERLSFNIDVRP